MARNLTPVTIWGIEFDALIEETKTMNSTIPTYPVEDGFTVSDTIINNAVQVSMTLYLSNTPVTWLYRHGTAKDRVQQICDELEKKWMEKELTKIVTSDTIYTNMGITSLAIKKTKELGYSREIPITASQVRVTTKQTVSIPEYSLKSGETGAKAGSASTSTSSAKGGDAGEAGAGSGSGSAGGKDDDGSSGGGRRTSILKKAATGASGALGKFLGG